MPDYIDREAAYQTLTEYYQHTTEIQHEALREALAKVPAADVRPAVKTAYHIMSGWPPRVYCMNCYKTFAQANWEIWQDGSLPRSYCPSCGAKLEGADGEQKNEGNSE